MRDGFIVSLQVESGFMKMPKQVVSPFASFCLTLFQSPIKKLKVYPGLRHALKFEPESAEVKQDAVEWFKSFLEKK